MRFHIRRILLAAAFTLVPEKVFQTAEFMAKIGSIKDKPAKWRDLFFPEIHNLPGN